MNEEYYGYCAKQHKTKELLRDYIQYDKMDDFSNLNGLIDDLLLGAITIIFFIHNDLIVKNKLK